MADPVEVAASCLDVILSEENENLRTCTPVHVTAFVPTAAATCEGQTAIPDLLPNGRPAATTALLSGRPVWYPGGGGFYQRWPLIAGDVALGIVSDRSLAGWQLTRTPGAPGAPTFPHFHNLSDTQILPVTDQPVIAEDDPGLATDYVLGGPAGEAFRVGTPGMVTITKSGGTVATITFDVAGSITIEVQSGQSVNIGGVAAVTLPKWPQLDAAIEALLAAGSGFVGTPADPTGENAGLAFAAAQVAYAAAKGTVPTTKAKGE